MTITTTIPAAEILRRMDAIHAERQRKEEERLEKQRLQEEQQLRQTLDAAGLAYTLDKGPNGEPVAIIADSSTGTMVHIAVILSTSSKGAPRPNCWPQRVKDCPVSCGEEKRILNDAQQWQERLFPDQEIDLATTVNLLTAVASNSTRHGKERAR